MFQCPSHEFFVEQFSANFMFTSITLIATLLLHATIAYLTLHAANPPVKEKKKVRVTKWSAQAEREALKLAKLFNRSQQLMASPNSEWDHGTFEWLECLNKNTEELSTINSMIGLLLDLYEARMLNKRYQHS